MRPEAPNNSTLDREQLARRAREPQTHLVRPGWGGWDPVQPLEEEPHDTYLGAIDVADAESHDVSPPDPHEAARAEEAYNPSGA